MRAGRSVQPISLVPDRAAQRTQRNYGLEMHTSFDTEWKGMSPWSSSAIKRAFDCACVVISLPVLIPLMLVIAAAVRFTSPGPILFLQERVGRNGKKFTIFKFRSMEHIADAAHHPITTSNNQKFTPVGPFLRRWKLDELPQLINVLFGQMSLVGPRPKMPEHVMFELPCRPGITGMATTVFACEERILARVPKEQLDDYYHEVVLPAKRELDAEYMACADFASDLRLIVNSVLRRWDTAALDEILVATSAAMENAINPVRAPKPARSVVHMPMPHGADRTLEAEQFSAL